MPPAADAAAPPAAGAAAASALESAGAAAAESATARALDRGPAATARPGPAATPPGPEPGLQDDAESLLRQAAARYAGVRSMRASFSMETRNPLLREAIRSRGQLFQRRPDRILMRFDEPAGDIIVSDGRYIWVWYPSVDSAQVLRSPAVEGAGGVDLLAQFVGDPTERFAFTMRGVEQLGGRANAVLVLDPRGEEAYRQLVIWIDRTDHLVRRFEITEHSGLVRRIELRDLAIDPDLPDSLFRFSPPAGARIVGGP